ncbi:MAG: hypothetical protein HY533_04680 [Chloroflexi bacterium]|nr:hypothetical protein [Chloroflexota bacterium]
MLTGEELAIAVVRILGALPVLRWPLAGSVIAILVDFSDLFMMNLLELGGVRDYQGLDKWLDLSYMATFVIAAWRWPGTPRNVAAGLFAYRILGVAVFEVTSWRGVLLFFPNVFEFWFLFVAAARGYWPGYPITPLRAALWLLPLLVLKEGQEYALHWAKWLDSYVAVDVVASWWRWLTGWLVGEANL